MTLTLTPREQADILRRRRSKGLRSLSGPKLGARVKPPADDGSAYMAWLHHDLPCIACLRLGPALRDRHIEAAHQKLNRADRGWHKRAGRRGPHTQCVPLCAFHHRTGAPCCDPAQEKFWAVLGFDVDQVIDLTEALVAAFREGRPGAPIIRALAGKIR